MLNQKQEFATGSGDHYDIRYGPKKDSTWKINFFSTTESAVLPLFLLPTTEVLQQSLGVKKASVLAITSAGQILDYAASLQANGILGRLDLTDFNHYQNLYVAYFVQTACCYKETRIVARAMIPPNGQGMTSLYRKRNNGLRQ